MDNVYNIGLLDYDVLKTRYYFTPNYDLGVTYAYLKQEKRNNVRLISSFSPNNLNQYDKIYIFKTRTDLPHPASSIQDYYKLPIEEYGAGFIDRPLRPNQLETRYIAPDFKCYNNMIMFSRDHPYHKIAWKIDKNSKGGKYQPVRLYEDLDGEILRKDIPTNTKLMVFDSPNDIINTEEKWEYLNKILDEKHILFFSQSLDISKICDTNILERVLTERKYSGLRHKIIVTELNTIYEKTITFLTELEKPPILRIGVYLPDGELPHYYFITMLQLHGYSNITKYKVRLYPQCNTDNFNGWDFALMLYRFTLNKPHIMSFYEYVFNISYLRIGVPKELIRTGEDRYEYIFEKYGMSTLLEKLEKWILDNPGYEDLIFAGGDSNYARQRRKYYDYRKSNLSFRGSANDFSS